MNRLSRLVQNKIVLYVDTIWIIQLNITFPDGRSTETIVRCVEACSKEQAIRKYIRLSDAGKDIIDLLYCFISGYFSWTKPIKKVFENKEFLTESKRFCNQRNDSDLLRGADVKQYVTNFEDQLYNCLLAFEKWGFYSNLCTIQKLEVNKRFNTHISH